MMSLTQEKDRKEKENLTMKFFLLLTPAPTSHTHFDFHQ